MGGLSQISLVNSYKIWCKIGFYKEHNDSEFLQGNKAFFKGKIKQCNQKVDSFKKLVQKTVNVKAKAAFQSYFYIYKTNQYCLKGNYLAHYISTKS